jgi:hypothetical protein
VRKLLATRAGVPPGGTLSLSHGGGLFAFAFWPFGKLLIMVIGFVCFAFVFSGSFFLRLLLLFRAAELRNLSFAERGAEKKK